ncbi:hypothetical protein FRC00_005363 [Tulasnella sp. 408]|nr:hypothetical protein FRC00_005363 [Tulasnella sp. 408]
MPRLCYSLSSCSASAQTSDLAIHLTVACCLLAWLPADPTHGDGKPIRDHIQSRQRAPPASREAQSGSLVIAVGEPYLGSQRADAGADGMATLDGGREAKGIRDQRVGNVADNAATMRPTAAVRNAMRAATMWAGDQGFEAYLLSSQMR